RDRPHGLAGGDAARGEDAPLAPAEEGVPDRERRVLPRRDDDERRDREEGCEVRHSAFAREPPASRSGIVSRRSTGSALKTKRTWRAATSPPHPRMPVAAIDDS